MKSRPWQVNLANEIRIFATSPRKMYAQIPALVNYAVWAIGSVWSRVLDITPVVPSPVRTLLLVLSTVFAYLFVFFWSKIIIGRKNLFFWPFEYFGVVFIAMLPTLLALGTYLGLSTADFTFLCLRLVFMVSVAESIIGFLAFRITKRSQELEDHQRALVDYEEKFLASVHDHLHDNVQTKLFGIGLQLNQIREQFPENESEKLTDIILEIESIRKTDVRDFGTEFTPQISTFGLAPSLTKLFMAHSKEMAGSVLDELSPPLTADEEAKYGLGVYRIAEQALINSLVHGRATQIELRIYRSKGNLNLQITNNGTALKNGQLSQGHGFAVIDGWVSKLNGSWSISNKDKLVSLDLSFR